MINHIITVRNRRIKVDTPRLIQGCTGSDSIILDLDDEWTGLDEILISIGSGDSRQVAIWDGEPMVIEHIDFPIGAHDAYYNGDQITWNGQHYRCVAPSGTACTWDPGTYPSYWELVAE